MFAAYLPHQTSGAYDFGATDSSKYSGNIAYASVDNSQGFWQFPSESYKVGSSTFDATGTVGIAGKLPLIHISSRCLTSLNRHWHNSDPDGRFSS